MGNANTAALRDCVPCDNPSCDTMMPPVRCCKKCKTSFYCSRSCQQAHRKKHKKESCKLLRKYKKNYQTDQVARDTLNGNDLMPVCIPINADAPHQDEPQNYLDKARWYRFCAKKAHSKVASNKFNKQALAVVQQVLAAQDDRLRQPEQQDLEDAYLYHVIKLEALLDLGRGKEALATLDYLELYKDQYLAKECTDDLADVGTSAPFTFPNPLDSRWNAEMLLFRGDAYSCLGNWDKAYGAYSDLLSTNQPECYYGLACKGALRVARELKDPSLLVLGADIFLRYRRYSADGHIFKSMGFLEMGMVDHARHALKIGMVHVAKWNKPEREKIQEAYRFFVSRYGTKYRKDADMWQECSEVMYCYTIGGIQYVNGRRHEDYY